MGWGSSHRHSQGRLPSSEQLGWHSLHGLLHQKVGEVGQEGEVPCLHPQQGEMGEVGQEVVGGEEGEVPCLHFQGREVGEVGQVVEEGKVLLSCWQMLQQGAVVEGAGQEVQGQMWSGLLQGRKEQRYVRVVMATGGVYQAPPLRVMGVRMSQHQWGPGRVKSGGRVVPCEVMQLGSMLLMLMVLGPGGAELMAQGCCQHQHRGWLLW
jgi:hypothetical protein